MGYRILKPVRKNPQRTEKTISVSKRTVTLSPAFSIEAKVTTGMTVLFVVKDDGRLCLDIKQGAFRDAFPIRIYKTESKVGLHYKVTMSRAIDFYGIPHGRFHVTGKDGSLYETDCFLEEKKEDTINTER